LYIYHEDENLPSWDFDPSQIFIGREYELSLFEFYLNAWKNLTFDADIDDTLVVKQPSPNNKIQGLVVLLHGRGGFGKSTLLRKYHNLVLEQNKNPLFSKIHVSDIIDWETEVEGERGIFNLPDPQEINVNDYFHLLCLQLANALDKKTRDFGEYQTAVKDVEKAHKKANVILDSLQKDERYAWLRGLAVEAVTTAIRTYVPGSKAVLDNPTVRSAVNEVAKITQEQASQLRSKLHDKLGNQLNDYLNPALRLGIALGKDLYEISKNYPLLIFFDTYEEIDEGDRLLRIVMHASGTRVGWIITGRDDLYAGWNQRERSIAMEYPYKDIVLPDRCLSVDFNAGGLVNLHLEIF
jgi:hypothetical protein